MHTKNVKGLSAKISLHPRFDGVIMVGNHTQNFKGESTKMSPQPRFDFMVVVDTHVQDPHQNLT